MSKRIVLCSDGTWNGADRKHPTNVVKTARAVAPVAPDGTSQVVFYDHGVGTGNIWDRMTGGAFGHGVTTNIMDAYRFLVHNWAPGDDIYLFGFSRGAYTARSTAGLIRNAGILKKEHADRIPDALALYRSETRPKDPASQRFRDSYARETGIKFIGVWDTVGSLGIPVNALNWITRRRHQFHDTTLSSWIANAFHALAIDEKRKSFKPTLWQRLADANQRVDQVWFAGAHSNIGGGYPDARLSDLALMWMLARARECDLALDQTVVDSFRPGYDGRVYESRRGIFRLLGSHIRPLGSQPEESLDPSVDERMRDDTLSYAPANLLAYLRTRA